MTPLAPNALPAVRREMMDWPQLPESPYLDFLAPDDVRVRHALIELSLVVDEHAKGRSAEYLVKNYPPLTLESVRGVLAYYADHREVVDRYLACVRQRARERRQAYLAQPPIPVVARLRELARTKKSA